MTVVYFIKPIGHDGPIKIGYSKDAETRLRNIEFWSPLRLEVVATIPGDVMLERRFHARFIKHHSHREWFHWSQELADVIAQIVAGEFDTESLPPPSGARGVGMCRRRTPEQNSRHGEYMRRVWAERKASRA